jgi:hypothetical protein
MTHNPNNSQCECKTLTCLKGCAKGHTHKTFFCEKCRPEPTEDWDALAWREFFQEYSLEDAVHEVITQIAIARKERDDFWKAQEMVRQEERARIADCSVCGKRGYL